MAFPTGWTKKCSLTIDNTKVSGSANLSNFPVLLTEANFPSTIFDNTQSAGQDLRFTSDSDGNTELCFEIVNWDTTNDKAEVWVKIPTVTHNSDTTFYVWYGNNEASAYAADATYGSENVWDSNYKLVAHDAYLDSTSNSNDGTLSGNSTTPEGKIGISRLLDGDGDYSTYGNKFNIADDTYTISGWWKRTGNTATTQHTLFTKAITGNSGYGIQYYYHASFNDLHWISGKSGGYDDYGFANTEFATNDYHFVTAVIDKTKVNLYFDGSFLEEHTYSGTMVDNTGDFAIGRDPGAGTRYWYGEVDEFRVYFGSLSSDWVATEYNNQNEPATFVTEGTETNVGSVGIAASKRIINS
jgi:hypothetical protein